MKTSPAMKIVILLRKLKPSEEQYLLDRQTELEVYYDRDYPPKNEQLKLMAEQLDRSIKDLNEQHIQRIIEFGHLKPSSKESISEILKQLSSSDWYYLRFSLFHRSRNLFCAFDQINALIKLYPAADFEVYSSENKLSELVGQKVKVVNNPKKQSKSFPYEYAFKYAMLFILRSMAGGFKQLFSKLKADKMIIANLYMDQEVFDLKNGKLKIGDPHIQGLIDATINDEDFCYLTQLRPPSFESNHKLSLSSYFKSRVYDEKSLYFESYLLEAIFSASLHKRLKGVEDKFEKLIRLRENHKQENEFRVLLELLTDLKNTLKLAVWRETAAKLMFNDYPIQKIIAIDEHSLQNRSILKSAEEKQIKSYAIQHGAISLGNIAYRFTAEDAQYDPFPTLTFIRGEHTFNQLTKNHYPENRLSIVGHPRTDVIPLLKAKKKGEPFILYATQPMPPADQALKEKQLSDFLSLCRQFPDRKFIIKAHPNESELTYYQKLAASGQYQNLSYSNDNLYQLLANCQILITYYSTVGLEAIYFDKPLVCLDYRDLDLQAYAASGVCHQVHNETELKSTVKLILEGKLSIEEEKKTRFIRERAYRIDGKVTQRILEEIQR